MPNTLLIHGKKAAREEPELLQYVQQPTTVTMLIWLAMAIRLP
ncbi:MAG: hypothetical protein ACTTHM_08630 [Peptoanaerobacter stomatis]